MGDFATQLDELKTFLSCLKNFNTKSEKSSLYSTLLQLQEHSTTAPTPLQSLYDSYCILLLSFTIDISDDDEEIAVQALKCMGFMIYHPNIVTVISGVDRVFFNSYDENFATYNPETGIHSTLESFSDSSFRVDMDMCVESLELLHGDLLD